MRDTGASTGRTANRYRTRFTQGRQAVSTYSDFIAKKRRLHDGHTLPSDEIPSKLFDWQAAVTRWAIKKGKAALFQDCGTGKSFEQLAWAQNVPGRVLILAPLCVAEQTVAEGAKLGIDVTYATSQPMAQGARIVITNYERLDGFHADQFDGVVLDESSILKAFDGKTRGKLIATFKDTPYRLCCTATPSPNDIAELANHAEFLGLMTRAEFLATWFVHDDQGWRMKGHARQPFYRWLASWAVALRTPSDIGYSDDGFVLPPLTITDHVVEGGDNGGALFPELGLKGLGGRLKARKASIEDRCGALIDLSRDTDQWIFWCGLNKESDMMAAEVDGCVNIQGSDSYEVKKRAVIGFIKGDIRAIASKARVIGFGMNFQNCHKMGFCGIGDSYEQYYQMMRRCWRFGQQHPVEAHIVVSDIERAVVSNVRRKQAEADEMSRQIIAHMRDFEREELAS